MALTLIRPQRHADARGWFSETYSARRLEEVGLDVMFVQDNQSWSRSAGTVRGLHFQKPPRAQAKLVSCLVGRILDCVVDIRQRSPTFGQSLMLELTDAGEQLFVPAGFAHGFMTLSAETLMSYKVSDVYDRSSEDGIAWDDPDLGLTWPVPSGGAVVSDKDRALAGLDRLDSPFAYDGQPLALREL